MEILKNFKNVFTYCVGDLEHQGNHTKSLLNKNYFNVFEESLVYC